jgi:hypothetical protein
MTTSSSAAEAYLTPDAAEYRKIIQFLASGSVNQRIQNGKPVHAAILLEAMFSKARSEMRIFTGELSPQTYDYPELITAAKQFLKRQGGRLRILIQRASELEAIKDRPLVSALLSEGPRSNFQLSFARGAYSADNAKHFAVMDDVGYRFETDHKNTRATANFNEPRFAADLISAFDRAFSIGNNVI